MSGELIKKQTEQKAEMPQAGTSEQDPKALEKLQLEIERLKLENKKLVVDTERACFENASLKKPWYYTTQGILAGAAVAGFLVSLLSFGISVLYISVGYEKSKLEGDRAEFNKERAEFNKELAEKDLAAALEAKTKAESEVQETNQKIAALEANGATLEAKVAALNKLTAELTSKLPAAGFVKVMGSKRELTPEEAENSKNPWHYDMWIEVTDPAMKDEIKSVTYFLNNPTFNRQVLVGQGEQFRAGYFGRSCLTTIVIIVVDRYGKYSQLEFDLCKAVGDDR